MRQQINKPKENAFQPIADSASKQKAQNKSSVLQQDISNSGKVRQLKNYQKMADAYSSKHPAPQINTSNVVQYRKPRRKGKFSAVGTNPAANSVTNMFIGQHIGNQANAIQVAQNRGPSGIAYSHTIDITEIPNLISEMNGRIQGGYYVAANQVPSPHSGTLQYLTGNAYNIWESKFDNKGRIKNTKLVRKQFYYDVLPIAGNALHHFDGTL